MSKHFRLFYSKPFRDPFIFFAIAFGILTFEDAFFCIKIGVSTPLQKNILKKLVHI
jgi:hypothetical protein